MMVCGYVPIELHTHDPHRVRAGTRGVVCVRTVRVDCAWWCARAVLAVFLLYGLQLFPKATLAVSI